MNRIDIVRQQRSVPLLNELLFSVLDAKPDDPLAFLINALERISSDVSTARGRLIDIRRSRKQLNETLVVARKHHRPVCITLLLHAGGDQRRYPLLREMYDNDHCLRHSADGADGGHPSKHNGVMLPPLLASLQGNDEPSTQVAVQSEETTMVAAPHPSTSAAHEEAIGGTVIGASTSLDATQDPTVPTSLPPPEAAEEAAAALVSEESIMWASTVDNALKSAMPTVALNALATHVRTASLAPVAAIEVLLVCAIHVADQFPSTCNPPPSPCCHDVQIEDSGDDVVPSHRESVVSIATATTAGSGESAALRALHLLFDIVREDAQRDALFPSLQALDDAVAFATPPPRPLPAPTSCIVEGVQPATPAATLCPRSHVDVDKSHFGPLMLLLASAGDDATYPWLTTLAHAINIGIPTNPCEVSTCGDTAVSNHKESAHRSSSIAAILAAAGRELPCLALLATAATAAFEPTAAAAAPNTTAASVEPSAESGAPMLWLSLLCVFAEESPARYPLTKTLLLAGAAPVPGDAVAVQPPTHACCYLDLLADIADGGTGSSRLRLLWC